MRIDHLAALTAAFVLPLFPAWSFEIELERNFSRPGNQEQLDIISTADLGPFTPIISAFQDENPGIDIRYVVASSVELFKALHAENASFDLAISSAMDLQIKLANDGKSVPYTSATTSRLPDWAKWRNEVFAFTREPAVLLISRKAFSALPVPRTRIELIELVRSHPDVFRDRVGTYDVRSSGLGYLFATQDSRNSEVYWRLTEVFGQLGSRLYCCSAEMIADVENGTLALAYNVLGSYAQRELSDGGGNAQLVTFEDYYNVMLRTALIPASATNVSGAGRMIDFLLRLDLRPDLVERSGFPAIPLSGSGGLDNTNSIHLGPSLLVFLDKLKRRKFLEYWSSSLRLDGEPGDRAEQRILE